MAEIWKPKDPALLRIWCNRIIEEAVEDLNEWECKFITDIQIKLDNGWALSKAQEDKLEQIYADKTS